MKEENQFKKFFASTLGRVVVTIISAVIIYGLIVAGLGSGTSAVFLATMFLCAYFGWKALNRITPDIFLIMPLSGWFVYFFIKGFLSAVIGAFVAPFQIGKMIANAASDVADSE